ncbi:MAG: DUF4252 domain-containing protein [Bacteroidales bacterium]|nr:DUF4252 domain-containing protein [Bacteroidales bacterium]
MKKTIITLFLLSATLISAWAGKPEKLERLARQYKDEDGIEMVSFGRLGIRLFNGITSLAGDLDKEDREVLKIFRGLKKIMIINFEDIPSERKAAFTAKAERILSGMDLVMETKDGDDTFRIYAIDDGNIIRDCILYSSDGVLIITKGRFNLDAIGKLIDMAE